jgi:sulfate adenylyltransferase subunit 2
MNDLDQLESQSVFILREAFRKIDKLALLWSIGKDSNVMVWLAGKAFFGRVPFPAIHIDSSCELPEMIAFRDRVAARAFGWNGSTCGDRPCACSAALGAAAR